MDTAAAVRKERLFIIGNLALGVAILITALLFNPFGYHKALEALSIFVFGMAVASAVKMRALRKDPLALIEENDERIVAARNRANAVSLGIIRYAMTLVFMFYTLARPQEVFESLSWWLVAVVLLLAVLLPPIVQGNVNKQYRPDDN